jgi:CheY-like chemotaxis protein
MWRDGHNGKASAVTGWRSCPLGGTLIPHLHEPIRSDRLRVARYRATAAQQAARRAARRCQPCPEWHLLGIIAVAVNDTGSGVAADQLEVIFEPFFTTKEVGKGTGLGLSQAFGFVKQSGGEILVTSELGKGSTFTIYLPQVDAPDAKPEKEAGLEMPAGGSGNCVLVVEDNEDVGCFSTELLQDLGYKIDWVGNADAALKALADNELAYDLVFSDVIMPGMNGVDLALVIRERYPGLPVVLTSGYSNVLAQNADRGFELIQKPYSVEALSRILRKAILEKRRTLERRRD